MNRMCKCQEINEGVPVGSGGAMRVFVRGSLIMTASIPAR